MRPRATMISLGSVIVLALVGMAGCTQESGTAVPSSHDGQSSELSVPTETTSPDDTGSTDFGPTDLNPTDLNPTDLNPTDNGEPTIPADTGELTASDTATAPDIGTGTGTASTSATQSTSAWSAGPNKTGGSPIPVFPDSLPGWRLNSSWDATTRATVADWAPAKGPDNGDFPTTVNGCNAQRFLVRWRANDDQARIEARWINAAGISGQSVSGHAGWFDLDGCTTPQFRFITSDGVATRSSVNVSVQRYFPD
jgi:hypothetical protein